MIQKTLKLRASSAKRIIKKEGLVRIFLFSVDPENIRFLDLMHDVCLCTTVIRERITMVYQTPCIFNFAIFFNFLTTTCFLVQSMSHAFPRKYARLKNQTKTNRKEYSRSVKRKFALLPFTWHGRATSFIHIRKCKRKD